MFTFSGENIYDSKFLNNWKTEKKTYTRIYEQNDLKMNKYFIPSAF